MQFYLQTAKMPCNAYYKHLRKRGKFQNGNINLQNEMYGTRENRTEVSSW